MKHLTYTMLAVLLLQTGCATLPPFAGFVPPPSNTTTHDTHQSLAAQRTMFEFNKSFN